MTATGALTLIAGPLVGTALYELAPAAPYVASAVLVALLFFLMLALPVPRGTRNVP